MTAAELAECAFITWETLHHIEQGADTARRDSLEAALVKRGIAETIIRAANQYESEAACIRINATLRAVGEA